ncbi:MAG: hypothetical protein EXS59_02275 [Candidatus Taylorbacteria bacterium]|nr:hypothetical protein [Candidatus Taylorbacteria bacterium]
MAKSVKIGVSLVHQYIEGKAPTYPMLRVHGWTEEHPNELINLVHKNSRGENMKWLENAEVRDFKESEPLPETLYVIVHCEGCRAWHGGLGRESSWYATSVYISKEMAESRPKEWGNERNWYWCIPVQRFALSQEVVQT